MRVPLKWLSEYVDLPLDPGDLARRLTIAGAEVGEVITSGGDWDGVTVGRVVDVSRHPNADRLGPAPGDLGGEQHTARWGAANGRPGGGVGVPLAAYLGEVVFDMDLTPNRPDLLSMVGIAHEVAALTGVTVREPSIEYTARGKPIKGRVEVEIADPDLCPRYVAALVEGVKIGESPSWMQERLSAAGPGPSQNQGNVNNHPKPGGG